MILFKQNILAIAKRLAVYFRLSLNPKRRPQGRLKWFGKVSSFIKSASGSTVFACSQKFLLLAFLVLFTFTACTPDELPISVQPAESKIAVASLIGPEKLMVVSLSRSFSALSAEDISELSEDFLDRLLLDSALVRLQYEGYTDTLRNFPQIPGLYFTQLQTVEDFLLMELSVYDSTSNESVNAQSVLLPPVSLDSAGITRGDTSRTFASDFGFKVNDLPGDNFFVVHVYQFTPPDTAATDSTDTGLFFNNQNFLIYEQLFTDRGAQNGIIRKSDVLEFTSPVDSALVVITNIEEGYYRFLEARKRSGGFLSSLANEPINHPTNVKNGVGYFSAHQPRAQVVTITYQE